VRVATWNVRHGRPRHGFASNRRLARAVADLDVDMLAVQEVDRRVIRSWFADQPGLVAEAMDADQHHFAAARHFLLLTGEDGIALSVRGELDCRRVLELPRADGAQRRVAIVADVTVGDDDATVVATHLHNDASVATRQLDALLEAIADEPRPRLLLGDLNLRPDDIAGALAAAGFALVDADVTQPAWAPVQRIDHIAVDGMVAGQSFVPAVAVSDHRPVVVEVRPASSPAP
jgi:endonuclease/exonuclease/phosphatase family metal-dependent hydrolase